MTTLYELCLTFTTPPTGAPVGTLAKAELRCDELGFHQPVTLPLLLDPLTDDERAELTWYLEAYWRWPYEEFAQRGARLERLLPAIGQRLYQTIFSHAPNIVQPWRLIQGAPRRVSIISNVPKVLSLPWELLHDEQGFLALKPVSIVRRLPQLEIPALPQAFALPLRVLLVTARPDNAGFVDPRSISRELLDELQSQLVIGNIALEFLRPPTRAALRERLNQNPPIHILHFDGHGTFTEGALPGGAQGQLAFEDEDGQLDLVVADDLAQLLQSSGVSLAVLTACKSAQGAADDLFSSVAARLIRSGVNAVVAMSASVLVASAAKYVEAFYRKLAAGETVAFAHERARQALHDNPNRHRHQRRRDEASQPLKLKDWWLPHFYQQRPLHIVVTATPAPARPSESDAVRQHAAQHLPVAPRYGFIGRAYELHRVERWLASGNLVVVHGFGGTGKTALAREAAEWLTRTAMYDAVCFVSFEHGGDAPLLLSAIGRRLGIATGEFDPQQTETALAGLFPLLRNSRRDDENSPRRTSLLIIADNLESVLPGGEAPLKATEREELWEVLKRLNEFGAGVILTGRNADFLAAGRAVKHLRLRGLMKEDGYALAEQLFRELAIPLARAPYPKLRDLLAQLDHHPLAIQLVLPALGETGMTIDRLSSELATLLSHCVDDREAGRNRSLAASLAYSLSRLGKWQQRLAARLATFEGSASEDDLLAITEIAEEDWLPLRAALERVALLTPEWIGNFSAPYLRFHPVFAPYLRALPDTDHAALSARHAARYFEVAHNLYDEEAHNIAAVRELAVRELPNLRRALHWLLRHDLERASSLGNCVIHFLRGFGMRRERDEWRERINQTVHQTVSRSLNDQAHRGSLTEAEFLRESSIGEDQLARGDVAAAQERFAALRARIEALLSDTSIGPESYWHCLTLARLARCFEATGQPQAAEILFRQGFETLDVLLTQEPENQDYLEQRAAMWPDLGDVLTQQGHYAAAQAAYEAGLASARQLGEVRGEGVALSQLGALALETQQIAAARQYSLDALNLFADLHEPSSTAAIWHQLGRIAEAQQNWVEAERCYVEALQLEEKYGDDLGTAGTYHQLALVAVQSGKPLEAISWFERTLRMTTLPSALEALACGNLANLLKEEVRAKRLPHERLAEAHAYAERALAIKQTLDTSAGRWLTEQTLADIAALSNEQSIANEYRRRARASFAAFAGNRWRIDRDHGEFIQAAAAVCHRPELQAAVEPARLHLEANGWRISAARERLWEGERNWHVLVAELDLPESLLILRVLETLDLT